MLVTGGAGFIGSNLVDALLADGHSVRVLDDLFSGSKENVDPAAELVVGSIADEAVVREAARDCELVFHVAAHRAVPRSVENPLATDLVNVHGTLAVLVAAKEAGARRVVSASSSSVYGGSAALPTSESAPLMPRSPYAVSKLTGEHYCRVFYELFGLETVSLRYFNVYGPRQRPDSAYAAVIPLFIDALKSGKRPIVHGDGRQSRDFTYVTDAVGGTIAAATAPADLCAGRAYNLAPGSAHTLLDLLEVLGRLLDVKPDPDFTDVRPGDVRETEADSSAAARDLGFTCRVSFEEGLRRTLDWFA